MNEKKTLAPPKDLDTGPSSPAVDLALENERLRKQLEELKASQIDYLPSSIGMENYAGKDEDGNEWWHYKIDLPPSGGLDIKINGVAYYHGQQYKVQRGTLQALKDIVARTWVHENSIKGSNENFYRTPTNRRLSGGAR